MKRLVLIIGALGLLYGILQILPPRGVVPGSNPWQARNGQRPLIIAHGGGQGLHPANSLPAFEHSATSGCDVLEMDLRLSKDGVLVTLHDATVDRTSDSRGRAVDYTLAELKAMNFGYQFKDPQGQRPYRENPARLATLEELFQRFRTLPMIIELKDRGGDGVKAANALARLVERYQMTSRIIVASFDDSTLETFRRASGGRVFTATALQTTKAFVILNKLGLDWFAPAGDHALQIPVEKYGYRLDNPGLLRAAHRRNMAVHYWTINDPDEMKRLIHLGADGIMTDRPDLLRRVIEDPFFDRIRLRP